jgi:deoxyribose-phosphate aldolase
MNSSELERLVAEITAQLLIELGTPCSCHAIAGGHCPDRLRSAVALGATRLGLHASSLHGRDLARYIDHTLLKQDASYSQIDRLCDEAAQFQFATVCIHPQHVRRCAQRLAGTGVSVCTVVGFPLGSNVTDVKAYEARRAVFDGACELDMVINLSALKSGDDARVQEDIASVVEAGHETGVLVKVILETALLTDEEKRRACRLARAAGADYVKTSTGFGPAGASEADVRLMREEVGTLLGVKAAGGIGDLEKARKMLASGADRIGASAGVKIIQASLGQSAAGPAPSY